MEGNNVLSTGIRTLDVVIGEGGIPNRSLVLVLGDVGYIHRLLVQNIVYHLSRDTTANTKVRYVLFDHSTEEIITSFKEIRMDISNIPEDRWEFIDMFKEEPIPDIVEMNPLSVLLSEYIDGCFNEDLIGSGRRLVTVIDSLSTFLHQIPEWGIDIDDLYSIFIKELTHNIKKVDGLHFWLMTRGIQEESVVNTLAHLSDVVFSLRQKQTGERVSNFIQIPKLGTRILREQRAREYPIIVSDNYQVRIDTKERIV
ncbi:MAG: RAD55 family ATPase [Promethearchaeota archaeon]